jgi:hypothetical protein
MATGPSPRDLPHRLPVVTPFVVIKLPPSAKAMVDEVEQHAHSHQRFTVGY